MTADTNGIDINGVQYATAQSNGHTAAEPSTMPLAIVGMACRFGGDVTSPEKLWELVSHGRDVWSEIPESRFNGQAFYHPDPAKVAAVSISHAYLLNQVDSRLQFWGISTANINPTDSCKRRLLPGAGSRRF